MEITKTDDTTPFFLRKRYLVVFLAFLGNVNLYTMRVDMSVAIVALTENQTIHHDDGSITYEPLFDWTEQQQGFALGAFFYGYICTQILGGHLANKIGGRLVFGFGIFATAFMTLLTPFLCYQGITYLIISRVIQGIFSGMAFPSSNAIYSTWSPPLERSRTASFGISGIYAGTIVANLLSGWLAANLGWESIFYVFGIAAVIWSIIWFVIVRDSPRQDNWISEGEKDFIENSLTHQSGQKNVVKIPWKSILTSKPLYAIACAHFAYNYGYYTLLTQLPSYMRKVLHFDLAKSGFTSAVPYVAQTILTFVAGLVADWFLVKNILTVTQVRKYFNNTALLGQMTFLLITTFLTNTTAIITSITISVGLGALAMSGYLANTIDIAPQFGSIIMGISNTFATIPGLISPPLTGFIAKTPTAGEYKIVFYITCVIYLIGSIIYGLFSTATVQPWALTDASEITKENKEEDDDDKSVKERY